MRVGIGRCSLPVGTGRNRSERNPLSIHQSSEAQVVSTRGVCRFRKEWIFSVRRFFLKTVLSRSTLPTGHARACWTAATTSVAARRRVYGPTLLDLAGDSADRARCRAAPLALLKLASSLHAHVGRSARDCRAPTVAGSLAMARWARPRVTRLLSCVMLACGSLGLLAIVQAVC